MLVLLSLAGCNRLLPYGGQGADRSQGADRWEGGLDLRADRPLPLEQGRRPDTSIQDGSPDAGCPGGLATCLDRIVFDQNGCTGDGVPCPAAMAEPCAPPGCFLVRSPLSARLGIDIAAGITILPAPYDPSIPGSGQVKLASWGAIKIEGSIDAKGAGYGGGGGGGGEVYSDAKFCALGGVWLVSPGGDTGADPSGELGVPPAGIVPSSACPRAGGKGGGAGGAPGEPGRHAFVSPSAGRGGAGGGAHGGAGGGAPSPPAQPCNATSLGCSYRYPAGQPGKPGGYLASGTNGDTSQDDSIALGSGGGGGSGGISSSGYCCGGGMGGAGGQVDTTKLVCTCQSGGGGAGGAAGGGSISIVASSINLEGTIRASGAGLAAVGGGHGAGGGILLRASTLTLGSNASIESLGGADDPASGSKVNGGTLKLRGTIQGSSYRREVGRLDARP